MNKHTLTPVFLAATVLLASPAVLLAQTAAPAKPAAAAKPVAAAKPAAKAPAPAAAASGTAAGKKRAVRRAALKAVEEVTPIDDDANVKLTDSDMDIARRVYVGVIPCELGASVTITANEKRPGFFIVQTKAAKFTMHPVEARTGAVRLEDPKAGALWIQLGNKSMLMSQKLGQRLADECMSPAQLTMADDLKKNPVPGLLDAPKPVVPAAPASAEPASAAK